MIDAIKDDIKLTKSDGSFIVIKSVTLNLSLQKNIVETPLVGRAGSVKEYVSAQDWQVSMRLAVAESDADENYLITYPEEETKRLLDFLEYAEALTVESAFLEMYGIKNVVVKSFSIVQQTHTNRQEIDVECVSDTPYEMELYG